MTGLAGYLFSMPVKIGIFVRFAGMALAGTGNTLTIMSPVIGIIAGGEFMILYLVAINTNHLVGHVDVVFRIN